MSWCCMICASINWKSNTYCWSDLRFSADCTTVIKDLNPLTQVAAVSESLATRSRLLFACPWIIEKQQSSFSIGGRSGSLARFFSACRPARLKMSRIISKFIGNLITTIPYNYGFCHDQNQPVFQPSRASLMSEMSMCCLELRQKGLWLGS